MGGFTAYELMDRMTSREFSEWGALFMIRNRDKELSDLASKAEASRKR